MIIRGEITEELIEDCKRELEKLDVYGAKANEKAKTTKNYIENKEWEPKILEVLSEEPMMVEELGSRIQWPYTRQRLTAVCTNLVREGRIGAVEIKVKNKGKRRGYIRG